MKQEYHSNAVTNVKLRADIRKSSLTNRALALKYGISQATASKWKNREVLTDRSSRPATIHYALSELETALIVSIRTTTWFPLDQVHELLLELNPKAGRSAVHRTFVREGINKVPQKEREKAKKFKEYDPGFLHVDVTYLPQIQGKKRYLFVAIDRATRTMFYKIYDAKTAANAKDFMNSCLAFFPFKITHVLTDNGLEFTNRPIKSKKGESCKKPSKLDKLCKKENIEHRLTKPATPKTNGMVERANQTIKKATIYAQKYDDLQQMKSELNKFLIYYLIYRRHGSLRKQLKVKTPFDAICKWYELKPEIFKQKPWQFKQKILSLPQKNNSSDHKQPRET